MRGFTFRGVYPAEARTLWFCCLQNVLAQKSSHVPSRGSFNTDVGQVVAFRFLPALGQNSSRRGPAGRGHGPEAGGRGGAATGTGGRGGAATETGGRGGGRDGDGGQRGGRDGDEGPRPRPCARGPAPAPPAPVAPPGPAKALMGRLPEPRAPVTGHPSQPERWRPPSCCPEAPGSGEGAAGHAFYKKNWR